MVRQLFLVLMSLLFIPPNTGQAEDQVILETDITFETDDGITLGATVFTPDDDGLLRGIVLVSGTGATERNA